MERQRVYLGVDSARFFLFHPDDCQEAYGEFDPPGSALDAGLVCGLALGADGRRGLELCDLDLNLRDHTDVDEVPFVFPLRVVHGRL